MATFKDLLYAQEQQIKDLLPAYITPQRFLVLAEQAYARNPDLRKCSPESILACVIQAADMGFELNTPLGHAYLIPRKSRHTPGVVHAGLSVGYRGLIDKAIRCGAVRDIVANVVRATDVFKYRPLDRHAPIIHEPDLTADGDDEKNIIGAYAVAFLPDGDCKGEYMNRVELEKVRAKAETDIIYRGWLSEMFRKAPVRRLTKFLRMSGEPIEVQRFSKALEVDAHLFETETVDADEPPPIATLKRRHPPTKNLRGSVPDMDTGAKNQEPQAPKKAAEVTPLSPAVAAPASSDPQPESCGFCHDAEPPPGHTFNSCPRNRIDPDFREIDEGGDASELAQEPGHGLRPESTTAALASAGAAANGRRLNDEQQAEIMRKAKLYKPRSSMGWLLGLIQRYGVDDLSMFPADKYEALLKTMDANA